QAQDYRTDQRMSIHTPCSREYDRYLPLDRCNDEALIEMRDIVKTFKTADTEFTALKGVTTCFDKGEFVSIVGKSGSGKSTLVNMLTGIDHPTSGSVRVGDTYIHKMSENEMSRWRGRNLGIVFQFFQLMPTLTLLENIMLPMALCGNCGPVQREKRSLELLDLVGLQGLADKLPAAVSGGQQQSAAIARALANDPPILIADEPTGNLDSRSADEVFEIFDGLIEQGKTILMVTHDSGLARRTHRTMLLSDGELINPWVAHAFADFSHSQMLWLTHHLQDRSVPAGAPVLDPDRPLPGIILVTDGNLEIAPNGHPTTPEHPSSLCPGEYISFSGAYQRGNGFPALQAGSQAPASLLVLEQPQLEQWVKSDPSLTDLLGASNSFMPEAVIQGDA
ncbi:MAG: ATP-binding cassette domain-containing protein, partial [Anaerolineales bacterium]